MSDFIEDIFGIDVFNETVMRENLPEDVFVSLKKTMEDGTELDPEIADKVAGAMKDWAMKKGATHYTHWFQPMTGITAEKHDSFLEPAPNGKAITAFSGKELIKGESDASSFPSGGLRATFEARGYTAWDCTSPAFVKEDAAGVTLCIPTAFCSYTGEALDKKTPLLRSMDALSREAVKILRIFGDNETTRVTCSVGPEQEYFLVDRKKYLRREDLIFTGRTLFGASAPKGQEMDDHYYGTIRERIAAYMKELNTELWKLGVYAKTQHNEAAPAQHELATVYTTANIACDHNQIVMDTMKKIARRHGLECILSEKPFNGVNGSGKHNNWSIATNTGENLLNPGKEPNKNTRFLLFLTAVIAAVDEHALLLRASASTPGNDNRLGGNEAPPSIISIFLGEQLNDIAEQIIKTGSAADCKKKTMMNMGVSSLPELKKDVTDRNRTSPFAFTGNKFEFRMVSSAQSIATPNTVLNTIVADKLREFADALSGVTKDNLEKSVMELIRKNLIEHQRILFDGDGYSDGWHQEAKKRGLESARTMVEACAALSREKTIEVFEREHVLSKTELTAREEINYEIYSKTLNIEAKTMIEMAARLYIPAVIRYTKRIADSIVTINQTGLGLTTRVQADILKRLTELLNEASDALYELKNASEKARKIKNEKEKASFYSTHVKECMNNLRKPIDELEIVVDKRFWPVPTYEDLMFEV